MSSPALSLIQQTLVLFNKHFESSFEGILPPWTSMCQHQKKAIRNYIFKTVGHDISGHRTAGVNVFFTAVTSGELRNCIRMTNFISFFCITRCFRKLKRAESCRKHCELKIAIVLNKERPKTRCRH